MRGFCLEVTGEFACFTRPEMKVERVSYDVITPAAARAIFTAILWKPALRWNVKKIEVLNPIKWISVRRNEVGAVASVRTDGIFIEDERQQRAGLLLREVKYRLYAEFEFIPPEQRAFNKHEPGADETPDKYTAMFDRRAMNGQCFHQPYLGCREFPASFRLIRKPANETKQPLMVSKELGWMFYDFDYSDEKNPRPMFFNAKMVDGVIRVPNADSDEVKR
ncbi:MAG: type I-C CRISPR-associated protein Cas5c [Verrucomicrobiales bacterium]|jgi:CRISPR-associated protein Cas5d|nr:type I-C CRISPR-associated protein Cas5c [Verrucomicrobiales bacterium]